MVALISRSKASDAYPIACERMSLSHLPALRQLDVSSQGSVCCLQEPERFAVARIARARKVFTRSLPREAEGRWNDLEWLAAAMSIVVLQAFQKQFPVVDVCANPRDSSSCMPARVCNMVTPIKNVIAIVTLKHDHSARHDQHARLIIVQVALLLRAFDLVQVTERA